MTAPFFPSLRGGEADEAIHLSCCRSLDCFARNDEFSFRHREEPKATKQSTFSLQKPGLLRSQ